MNSKNKNIIVIVILACLAIWVIYSLLDSGNNIPTPEYTECSSRMVGDCLVVEVITDNQDSDSRSKITDDIIKNRSWDNMIRVFFYTKDETPGIDIPKHRESRNSYSGNDPNY